MVVCTMPALGVGSSFSDAEAGLIGHDLVGPRRIVERLGGPDEPRYSLCAMVTRPDEYRECIESFASRGFDDSVCERLIIDNSGGNKADAYTAINEFLQAARGEYVIIHHHDVELLGDDREVLDSRLEQLTALDSKWAICGNAGLTEKGWPAICISHPHRDRDIRGGPFPVRVVSLDENFLVIRRLANLSASSDLKGFHHYGVDLCTIADVLGWRAYVIDFLLWHKSGGTLDASYTASRKSIAAKYQRAFRTRMAYMITNRHIVLSSSKVLNFGAPVLRKAGKVLGLIPRIRDIEDPAKCARANSRL